MTIRIYLPHGASYSVTPIAEDVAAAMAPLPIGIEFWPGAVGFRLTLLALMRAGF